MMVCIALYLVIINPSLFKYFQSHYYKLLLLRVQGFGARSTTVDIPLWQEVNKYYLFYFSPTICNKDISLLLK